MWMDQAECRDSNPIDFDHEEYPQRGARRGSLERALDDCEACPVRAQCAADAALSPTWGVRGGTIWVGSARPRRAPRRCKECGTWVMPNSQAGRVPTVCGDVCRTTLMTRLGREAWEQGAA